MIKGKKAEGILRKMFIGILLFCMGFLALFFFYFDITTDYKEILNFSEPREMGNLSAKINETFNVSSGQTVNLLQSLQTSEGTQSTGESATILNSFFGILSFIGKAFKLLPVLIGSVAYALKIPDYWWQGFIAILTVTAFIVIIAGFLRSANW